MTCPPSLFLNIFLLFSMTMCFRWILYFPCPSAGINHFSEESWFPLEANDIKDQDLIIAVATRISFCILAHRTKKCMCHFYRSSCMHVYVYIDTYTHTYIFFLNKSVHIDTCSSSRFFSYFPYPLLVTLLLIENPGSQHHHHLLSLLIHPKLFQICYAPITT